MRDDTAIPLRRLMALRQFAMFANADLGELAIVVDNLRETTIPAGMPPTSGTSVLHFVLDGRIETRRGDIVESWGSREVYGWLEVLARRSVASAAVAAVETRTLTLAANDYVEVLEDNFGLLRSTLRELAARVAHAEVRPRLPRTIGALDSDGPLTLVERLIVLRRHAPFAGGRLQALAAIAHAAEEVMWPVGTTVTEIGQVADAAAIVLSGALRASSTGCPTRLLGPGDACGSLETLGGLRHLATTETLTEVRALRCSGATILDVLEDHTDLGLEMIATFAAALLDGARCEPS